MSKTTRVKVKVQPTVVMESEVARKIRQHARSSMKAEVCGVLIGSSDDERTVVDASIPGVNAAQGGAHVTFTQDTWEHIYKIKDKDYPDDKIVGWYHSHPGFGVFLSEHDLFIQENFFSSRQQIAWVYDPHTDEEGCFGWVSGKIEKLSGVRFGYLQNVEITGSSSAAEEIEDETESQAGDFDHPRSSNNEPAFVRWTFKAMTYLSILLMGFVLGFLYVHYQVDPLLRECQDLLQHVVPITPGTNVPQLDNVPPQGSQPASPGAQKPPKGNDGKH
jgi:proteasome lid subunit RPN8/RPN11